MKLYGSNQTDEELVMFLDADLVYFPQNEHTFLFHINQEIRNQFNLSESIDYLVELNNTDKYTLIKSGQEIRLLRLKQNVHLQVFPENIISIFPCESEPFIYKLFSDKQKITITFRHYYVSFGELKEAVRNKLRLGTLTCVQPIIGYQDTEGFHIFDSDIDIIPDNSDVLLCGFYKQRSYGSYSFTFPKSIFKN